jgi:hypothetical protein
MIGASDKLKAGLDRASRAGVPRCGANSRPGPGVEQKHLQEIELSESSTAKK